MEIIAFLMTNWEVIITFLFALHGLALAIANLTPTPKDDEFLGKAYKVIEFLAGLWTPAAKELPGEREVNPDRAG
ncbi:hypothetical protein [Telmatospirillum sp. J64-1]|uniref:hypothetical protein n=1 Tax=Telmatospirillum sp. J64-1 TaxID=2502183 RepID=UPI00115F6FA3|nr:hypothetical protein [Telmatospirillum sp. J64-1]